MPDLQYLSATESLRMFREKSISPLELLDALIDGIETSNPAVNAVAEPLYEQAREQAQAATQRYARRGVSAGPLDGLAVAAKAEQPIQGHVWSDGSLAFATRIADVTHPVIERIKAAGGFIHMRTTTPEFSAATFTHSRLWGVTRNPWNLHYSPGGSSGGSAAALAAGMAPLATGSDIGGSIRIPAAFSGVVGYKPPFGRVPDLAPFNLDPYCHVGPMARSVADCALLQNVMVGPHPKDHASLRPAVFVPTGYEDMRGKRIAVAVNLGDWVVEPEVEANTRATADALRDAGATVEEVHIGLRREDVRRASGIHFGSIFGRVVREAVETHGDLLTTYAKDFAARFESATADGSVADGLSLETAINERISPILERHVALVCPTSGFPALVAGEDYVNSGFVVAGREVDPMFDAIMTLPFNILSRCPVLAVPSGRAANGVPTGVQIVGRTFDDASVFHVGAAIERVRPWGHPDAAASERPAGTPAEV